MTQRIVEMARDGDKTAAQIAEALGCKAKAVHNAARYHGVNFVRLPRGGHKHGSAAYAAKVREDWLACHADGLTAREAAERMRRSRCTANAAAHKYGFTWATKDKGGRPSKAAPEPKLPQSRKAKPRDPLRGGVVLSLRGGAATYGMQIASALQSAPAGTRLIYCRARADECGPAKAAAAKVAASTGAVMTQWPIGTGEGRLWAYSIARGKP